MWQKMLQIGSGGSEPVVQNLVLYDKGEEYTDVTGGWASTGYSNNYYSVSSGSKSSEYMLVKGSSGGLQLLGTQKAIDVSKYNTLKFTLDARGSAGGQVIATSPTKSIDYDASYNSYIPTFNGVKEIDVSALDEIYISFMASNDSTRMIYVSKVELCV